MTDRCSKTQARIEAALGETDAMRATLTRLRGRARGDANLIAASFLLEGELEASLGNIDEALAAYTAADVANPDIPSLQYAAQARAQVGPAHTGTALLSDTLPPQTRRTRLRAGGSTLERTQPGTAGTTHALTVSSRSRTLMRGCTIRETREQTDSVEEPEFDLREVLHALRDYKWLIAAITAAVLVAGTVWTLRTPKIYEAVTTVEYDPNPSRPLGGEVQDVADPIGNFWATREFFGTQNLVIASRDVAERVVQKLGLHEDPSYLTQDDDTLGETGNRRSDRARAPVSSHRGGRPRDATRSDFCS